MSLATIMMCRLCRRTSISIFPALASHIFLIFLSLSFTIRAMAAASSWSNSNKATIESSVANPNKLQYFSHSDSPNFTDITDDSASPAISRSAGVPSVCELSDTCTWRMSPKTCWAICFARVRDSEVFVASQSSASTNSQDCPPVTKLSSWVFPSDRETPPTKVTILAPVIFSVEMHLELVPMSPTDLTETRGVWTEASTSKLDVVTVEIIIVCGILDSFPLMAPGPSF
mmetsp:Transcript_17091/g.35381  ORF Transcript_17091/g.35381 Transcript_17091/m.35381 type:complete len:229 (+) Transcript_17091:2782-3468(+)